MNPIKDIVPKIRTSAEVLKFYHVFGLKPDLIKTMMESRKSASNWTVHIEAAIETNSDGSEHIVTIEIMKYDDSATVTDQVQNKAKKPASEIIMIEAYNAGIDLINELNSSFEDHFDIQRQNSFPFVKINNVSTGYLFRLRFLTQPDICY